MPDEKVFRSLSVDQNSPTPYSDATMCRKPATHVKRPMNAFMVWSQIERRKIIEHQPELHNADISKHLGKRWRELSNEERQPFVAESQRLRKLHHIQYPDYKYKPKKKLNAENSGSENSPNKLKALPTGKVTKPSKQQSKVKKLSKKQQAYALRQQSIEAKTLSECSDDWTDDYAYSPDSGCFTTDVGGSPSPASTPAGFELAECYEHYLNNRQSSSLETVEEPSQLTDLDNLMEYRLNSRELNIDFTPANAHLDFDLNSPELMDIFRDVNLSDIHLPDLPDRLDMLAEPQFTSL